MIKRTKTNRLTLFAFFSSEIENKRLVFCLLAWLVTLFLSSCTSPVQKADEYADNHHFEKRLIDGKGFQHIVYTHNMDKKDPELHVYIEGDGSPWSTKYRVSSDPTPRNPIMLHLMQLDKSPALYLGRPCYFGTAKTSSCNETIWTSARYSAQAVQSMEAVLLTVLSSHEYSKIVFIGHSGGGTLAMLLAPLFPKTSSIVTLSGNLDPDSWARYHQYSPLMLSLNPRKQPPLDQRIAQYHFIAENDTHVPPELIVAATAHQLNKQVILIPDIDHACCWKDIWVDILQCLKNQCTY